MAVSYNKLWKLLIDRKLSKAELRKIAEISPNTIENICERLACAHGGMGLGSKQS